MRVRQGETLTATVPSVAERGGDFSELLGLGPTYQIYDPSTRRRETGSTTRYRQDAFPGNIVPVSRFNPVSLKVLDFFALPINSGTTADHRNNFPQPNLTEAANYYTHTARIDHNFSPRNRLFVRGNGYSRNTWRQDYFNTRATGLREQYLPISGSIDG